jgi:hypothetical protein
MRLVWQKIATLKAKWKENRGASMVEFAIVLPLLLLLVFGIIEFGLIVYNKQILTNACREGARAGVVQAAPPTLVQDPNRYTVEQIDQVVRDYCSAYMVTFASGVDNPKFLLLDAGYVDHCPLFASPPKELQVKISYDYHFLVIPNIITGLFSGSMGGTITLTADTIMTCE